jgi:hypothetical protein
MSEVIVDQKPVSFQSLVNEVGSIEALGRMRLALRVFLDCDVNSRQYISCGVLEKYRRRKAPRVRGFSYQHGVELHVDSPIN